MDIDKSDPAISQKERLFKQITTWLKKLLDDPARKAYADQSIKKALLREFDSSSDDEELQIPESSDIDQNRMVVSRLYFELLQIHELIDQTQYYFRRYPFHDLPVSRSAHLANICELFFDRFGRFRDRVKNLTKEVAKQKGAPDERYGRIIRWIDKTFEYEIRQRNHSQHHGRFENSVIEQLTLMNLLSIGSDDFAFRSIEKSIYRKEARNWVRKCVSLYKGLSQLIEILASLILELGLWEEFDRGERQQRPSNSAEQ